MSPDSAFAYYQQHNFASFLPLIRACAMMYFVAWMFLIGLVAVDSWCSLWFRDSCGIVECWIFCVISVTCTLINPNMPCDEVESVCCVYLSTGFPFSYTKWTENDFLMNVQRKMSKSVFYCWISCEFKCPPFRVHKANLNFEAFGFITCW